MPGRSDLRTDLRQYRESLGPGRGCEVVIEGDEGKGAEAFPRDQGGCKLDGIGSTKRMPRKKIDRTLDSFRRPDRGPAPGDLRERRVSLQMRCGREFAMMTTAP